MKTLALLCLLLIPAFAAAEMGTWTLYYCDTETVNGSGNLVVTPTVSITGNDGGNFCDPQSCNGLEQAFVMLNGNAWKAGYTVPAGLSNPGEVYTFPNVTIAPGASADLSYAGKVEGTIQLNDNDYWTSPNMIAFYQTAFEEGNGVYAPSPCWINGYEGNSPACEGTWPVPWAVPIRGWATYDLTSQQVAQTINWAVPTSETTALYNPPTYLITEGTFVMTLNPSTSNFDEHYVEESDYAQGSNTCYWDAAKGIIPQYPSVAGNTPWTVGANGSSHNQYGLDSIGFDYTGVNFIQANAPENDVDMPCVVTFYQQMTYEYDANTFFAYANNIDTQTIGSTTVKVCRTAGVCTPTIQY